MNKNRFRIVFNAVRSMMMAVAEFVKSHAASADSTDASSCVNDSQNPTTPSDLPGTEATIRPFVLSIMLALGVAGIILYIAPVYADIIADPTASTNQRPVVINAPNGVPLVNIQTPSAAGVSHNIYRQFDVNTNGAILNNSRTNVQTQVGGWVQGNPYLATGTARIILNEVNSSNPSMLNGYVEVAGSRAQVVIANPAGISCNGCGFINTSRATLTTGTPLMNSGDLMGYRVGGGVIHFLGAGLDSANSNYTDVIARAVNVNAGLWAQNLNVITGSNQVTVASNGDVTGMTPISPDATLPDGRSNPIPSFTVDVAALGGMYAGKIHMIGTETGVGVRNAGNIGASAGEVTIDVDGMLTNSQRISSSTQTNINAGSISNASGTVSAGQLLEINATSLSGDGSLLSGGNASITLFSDYTQTSTGELQANGNLSLSTTGNITNEGNLLAGNTLTLNATNINNSALAEISSANTYINAANTLINRGLIDGSDTFIHADTVNNVGSGSIFGDHLAISVNTLNNQDEVGIAAIIAARSRLDIGASDISNINDSLMFSAGDIAMGGALDASHLATGQASVLNNAGASIEALGNMNLNVAQINNTNTNFTTQYVRTSVASTLAASVDVRGNIGSPAPAAGNSRQYQLSHFSTDGALLFGRVYNYDEIDHFYLDGSGFVHLVLKAGVANDGVTDTNTFMQYNSGSIVYETQTLTTQPGQIMAGNNMQVDASNLYNSDSRIIAGGTFNANVVALNNQETLGVVSTQYGAESAFFRTRESCNCSRYFQYPNYPAPVITIINLGSSAYGAVSTVSGSGATVATLTSNNIPANSLFTPTSNPQSSYLIETNPRFANYRNWLSSDYMLTTLNLDPALTAKRLGDGFYEQRLIREQINNLTGLRFLVGYADDETQYQALMTNGATFAQAHQLVPGVALTAEQIAQLTSDIVWLVEQTVTLPDGSQAQALVPQVYARLQPNDLSPNGSLIAGQTLNLNVMGEVINGGDLAGREALNLNAENINNLAGRIRANTTQLSATQDINNLGGQIIAQDVLSLNAGHNINIESTTADSTLKFELDQGNKTLHVDNKRTNIDRVAGLYITNPSGTGLLVASSGNDIDLNAAEIVNLAPTSAGNPYNGQTLLIAGNDISLGTVTTTQNNSYVQNAKNYNKDSNNLEVGSTIQTAGNNTLQAGQNLNIKAGDIESTDGTLTGNAGNNISITSGTNTFDTQSASYKKKSGFMSSSKKTTRDTSHDTEVVSSNLSADSIALNAQNINVDGSHVVATNNVELNATANVNITAATDTHDETHYKKVSKTGFTASSTSIGYGSSKLTNTNDSQQVTNVGSTVGSVEGDVNISASKTYTQTGSDILTPQGDINITAQQVNIINATDTYANQQRMKYKQSGITLSVSSSALNLAQNVAGTAEAAITSDSSRNKALNALQTYANASTLQEQGKAIVNAAKTGNVQDAASAAGVKLSVSIGSSSAKSNSSTNVSTQQDSLIKAGGNVTIKATQDDITVKGSQIEADKNLKLEAAKNINLVAGADTESNQSKNKSSSTSIGVSVGIGAGGAGLSIDLAASRGKGNANSDSTTYNNTHVAAVETLTLDSGNDTNLIGANAEGKQVVANVGGNLNIQSLQDVATSQAKQSNTGISISVPVASPTLGNTFGAVSQSKQNSNSNYNSVYEQSGIKAGEEGFNIKVNNNTDLKGAVIESIAAPDKNQLTTGTLTTSNIQNNMDVKASSSGTTLGTDMLNSKYGAIKGIASNLQNHGEENISDNSTTLSAISPAAITITDEAKQQQITGNTGETTLALLNRDTTDTNRVLAKPDMEALQEKVQQEQADKALLLTTITAFTDESFRRMFIEQTKMYKVLRDQNGTVQWLMLSPEEKMNLKPGIDGKVHIFNNGIFNTAEDAKRLATQNNNADYLVYFPKANNFFSELMVAGYQKFLEGSTLGLTNATQVNVEIISQYGQDGLQVDGHSRGGLTTGNALEAIASQSNTLGSLSNTNISLFGSAYNAQHAANLLKILSNGNGTVQSQVHIDDFVGNILGHNVATGGTTPEESNLIKEWIKIFYGKATAHNGYGDGKEGGISELYWMDFQNNKPASVLIKPTN